MPLFRVYYPAANLARTVGFMMDGDGVEASKLRETHRMVAVVEKPDLEGVFEWMNLDFPKLDVRDLIEAVGVTHTSMSVGDCAVDEDDTVWLCAGHGWKNLGKLPERE